MLRPRMGRLLSDEFQQRREHGARFGVKDHRFPYSSFRNSLRTPVSVEAAATLDTGWDGWAQSRNPSYRKTREAGSSGRRSISRAGMFSRLNWLW
jgi:hypothetical protein